MKLLGISVMAVHFGDATDADFMEHIPLTDARWAISTFPDLDSNRDLINALRAHHYCGEIAVVARDAGDGVTLKSLGVPTVLYPTNNAVDYVVNTLTRIIRHQRQRSPHSHDRQCT